MEYKLIGIRPNHAQMRQMVGKTLYSINHQGIIVIHLITNIEIKEDGRWGFVITGAYDFEKDHPLFATRKSAIRYAKKHNIELL